MIPDRKATLEQIAKASKTDWDQFVQALRADANNSVVTAKWQVDYDPLGHDVIFDVVVHVASAEDALLQTWLKDQHPGIWIPEYRPWIASVVEFSSSQEVKHVRLGMIDSKWRKEDAGATYQAILWGYVQHGETISKFVFERDFVFPG